MAPEKRDANGETKTEPMSKKLATAVRSTFPFFCARVCVLIVRACVPRPRAPAPLLLV